MVRKDYWLNLSWNYHGSEQETYSPVAFSVIHKERTVGGGGEQCSSLKRIDSCRGRGDLPARVDTPTIFFFGGLLQNRNKIKKVSYSDSHNCPFPSSRKGKKCKLDPRALLGILIKLCQ